MNNKNTLIGFVLIAAILFGWMYFMTPSKEQIAEQQRIQDSIRRVRLEEMALDSLRQAEQQRADAQLAALQTDTAMMAMDSLGLAQQRQNALRDKYGVFAASAEGSEQLVTIENKLQRLTFSNKGGFLKQVELKDYKTYDSLPLISFDPETALFDLSFFANNRIVNTAQFYFKPYLNGQPYAGGDMTVGEGDSIVFSQRLTTDDPNKYIEFVYTIRDDNYMMDFDIRTVGMKDVIANNADYMSIDWAVDLLKQEKSADRFADESVYFHSLNDKDVDHLVVNKDSEQTVTNKLKWISFKQRFFCNVIVAKDGFETAKMAMQTRRSNNPRYYKSMSANIEVPYNVSAETNDIPMQLYFGPNHFKTLRSYKIGLQDQINLGNFFLIRWINYGVIAVFNWLSQ